MKPKYQHVKFVKRPGAGMPFYDCFPRARNKIDSGISLGRIWRCDYGEGGGMYQWEFDGTDCLTPLSGPELLDIGNFINALNAVEAKRAVARYGKKLAREKKAKAKGKSK